MAETLRRAPYGTFSNARREAKDQSRRSLSEATCDLVLAFGVHEVTVDMIVSHAGLSRSTFYMHFQSREEIFADLRQRMTEKLDGLYDSLAAIAEPTYAHLIDWALFFIENCRHDRRLILTLIQAGKNIGLTFDSLSYYELIIARLAARFPRFQAASRHSDVHAEAVLLLMQVEGLIRYVSVQKTNSDDVSFCSTLAKNLFNFLNDAK